MNDTQMVLSSGETEVTERSSRRQVMAGFGAIALGAMAVVAMPGSTFAALEPAAVATNRDLTNNTQHTKHTKHTRHTRHGSRRRRNRRR